MNQGEWIEDQPPAPRIFARRAGNDKDESEISEPWRRDVRFWMSARRGARSLAKSLPDCRAAHMEGLAAFTEQARKEIAKLRTPNLSHMSANARKGR